MDCFIHNTVLWCNQTDYLASFLGWLHQHLSGQTGRQLRDIGWSLTTKYNTSVLLQCLLKAFWRSGRRGCPHELTWDQSGRDGGWWQKVAWSAGWYLHGTLWFEPLQKRRFGKRNLHLVFLKIYGSKFIIWQNEPSERAALKWATWGGKGQLCSWWFSMRAEVLTRIVEKVDNEYFSTQKPEQTLQSCRKDCPWSPVFANDWHRSLFFSIFSWLELCDLYHPPLSHQEGEGACWEMCEGSGFDD